MAVPVADGGWGRVVAFLYAEGGEKMFIPRHGSHMEPIIGLYGLLLDATAVVEMAAASGLPLA